MSTFFRSSFYITILSLSGIFCSNQMEAQELSMWKGSFKAYFMHGEDEINRAEFKSILYTNVESKKLWQKSTLNYGLAWGSLGVETAGLIWLQTQGRRENKLGPIGLMLGGLIGVFYFETKSIRQKHVAINAYNAVDAYYKQNSQSFRISNSDKGIGLTLHF